MALFGKGKVKGQEAADAGNGNGGNGNGGGDDGNGGGKQFPRDPRKAARFFEHAQTVSDARNYDYAIELYINGLRLEPDNMPKHEALHEVAERRKVQGGKPAGLMGVKKLGSSSVDKMLTSEKAWSMDPLNLNLMLDVMGQAVDADSEYEDLSLSEVAFWVGDLILAGRTAKPPKKKDFLTVCENFKAIGRFDKAVEAMKRAIRLAPNDDTLLSQLKDLEAERTMQEGRYGGGEGDFRANIKDADKQRELEIGDARGATASQVDELIARRRAEYDEDPDDLDRLNKLVEILARKETNETEKEAITLLNKAWEETGQYRYKVRAGDITMKQINRYVRQLKAMYDAAPGDDDVTKRYRETLLKKLQFEMQEYSDRVKNYPTDMSLKFELGKRLFQASKFDEAIGMFQQSKADPKSRASAHIYLGRCYVSKGWLDEAINTLGEGIDAHPIPDDRIALDLRYLKMDALIQAAEKSSSLDHAKDAQQIASKILQTDINFRDIRDRMEQIKALIDKLSK